MHRTRRPGWSVRREEGRHGSSYVGATFACRRYGVVAEQHGVVERSAHDEPVQLRSGFAGVGDRDHAAVVDLGQQYRYRLDGSVWAVLGKGAGQGWESRDLSDDEPAQL
jgi:hypothetical protein